MKKNVFVIIVIIASMQVYSQKVLQLEDCRQMALTHNKSLQMAQESVKVARQLKEAAFTQFLPNFSANGHIPGIKKIFLFYRKMPYCRCMHWMQTDRKTTSTHGIINGHR